MEFKSTKSHSVFVVAVLGMFYSAFGAEQPEFSRYCAMGLAFSRKVPTDCSVNWTDPASSKKYCFSSEDMRAEWMKDPAGNEKKAREEFSKISKSK